MSIEKKIRKLEKRDGSICGICKQDMTQELERLHRMFLWRNNPPTLREILGLKKIRRKTINVSIDHVIPVSKGGRSDLSNLALAHWTCNQEKGASLPETVEMDNSIYGENNN